MADIAFKFEARVGALEQLANVINDLLRRKARNNFGDIRPFVEDGIERAVEASKDQFIPNENEVAELGIGVGGAPDENRINGAYRQLNPDDPSSTTKFSVQKTNRRGSVGRVKITIDNDVFYSAELSKVSTPDSDKIDEIPWMRWLIEGAPINPEYAFKSLMGIRTSRTGRGIMVRGGVWDFPPARSSAFAILRENIEREVKKNVEREVGRILE